MICVSIPGWRSLEFLHLVLDLNGTIALDGQVLPGVAERLAGLSADLTVHLVTAETHGQAALIAERLRLHLCRIAPGDATIQKGQLVAQLGPEHTAAIGNGVNDGQMLAAAVLGIAVLGTEGLATAALQSAHLVVGRIEDALDLLLRPQRLVATLRR
jgi:P-type E1-E2 ATPase